MTNELSFEKLRKECDPETTGCKTTKDIPPLTGIVGQDRAVRALKFGLGIEERGFNIFVSGQPGTGRTTAVKDFLEGVAKTKPIPDDWCYVNNFKNSYEPKAIRLHPGKGKIFKTDVENLIKKVSNAIPKAFESEEYSGKRDATIRTVERERNELLAQLNAKAQKEGFVLQTSPVGFVIAPVVNGKPLNDQDFMALSPQTRDEIQKRREKLGGEFRNVVRQLRALDGKINDDIRKLEHEVASYAIDHLFSDLKEKYNDLSEVIAYLQEVEEDILENFAQFIQEPQVPGASAPIPGLKELLARKYEVNVIVDNSSLKGAPVIIEQNPTYQNLIGRIEKEAQFGVLTTDFTLIQAGSLHKANGGYFVLSIEQVLQNLLSWDGLKRALRNNQITIEDVGERLGYVATKTIRPEAIPLDIKVVLIGQPMLYSALLTADIDFKELFKVKADFDTVMDRTEENMRNYVSFVCTFCEKEDLKHLDASAVAKIIEYGSRLAEDQEKLSVRFADVADIIREAHFYADQDKSKLIDASHVKRAIEEETYRSNLIQEKLGEMIQKGVILIATEGEAVGQVNGLSVMELGDFAFGIPSRVTVSTSIGDEGIIDIEREARLGGRIHTKGVLILNGYLSEKYVQHKPVSLSARLVFEQSYGEVDGDSASSTELYAILSSLSGLPIKQSIAVTGSVNQKGEVQAIGGVNEKIEGYFEVCKLKGLTGHQGVMIPESNVQNLMLKEEVVEAVKAGKFHIYPIKTIDQGIEVLTGVKASARKPDETFEEGTIDYLVDKRFTEMAEKMKEFAEKKE